MISEISFSQRNNPAVNSLMLSTLPDKTEKEITGNCGKKGEWVKEVKGLNKKVKEIKEYKLEIKEYTPGKGMFGVVDYRNRFGKIKPNPDIKERKLLLPENPIEFFMSLGITEKNLSSCCSFIGFLRLACENKDLMHKESTFAHVHSFAIRKTITRFRHDARPFLMDLYSCNLVETDGKFSINSKSTGYKLGERLNRNDIRWTEYKWEEVIAMMPEKSITPAAAGMWSCVSQYFTSWKDLPDGELKETCSKVEPPIRQMRVEVTAALEEALRKAAEKKHAKNLKEKGESWPASKILSGYHKVITDFNDGLIFLSADARTGRIFHNITSMKKEARGQLYIGDTQLITQDIISCQPALLSACFDTENPADLEEKARFIDDITNKDIYAVIAGPEIERDVAKVLMYKIMFGLVWMHQGPAWDNFKALYPILADRIVKKKLKEGYRSISAMLQKFEATILITGALNELLDAGKLVTSCHDALISLPEDAALVKATMIKHFLKHMGFEPRIS